MADIDITCPKCGHFVTVSEFADPKSIACRKCGEKLGMPEGGIQKAKPTVKLAMKEDGEAPPDAPQKEWQFHKHVVKDESAGKGTVFTSHHVISWSIFLVLGGIGGWLRYGGQLEPLYLTYMKDFAPYVLLGIHLTIIIAAFKDSMFQGILGLMIPPYPYYYVFAVSDQFYLRAVVGGSLVGFGQDAFIFASQLGVDVYNAVTGWIAQGG